MSARPICIAIFLLSCWFTSAAANDLAKVDRTIVKQPAYQHSPRYCLLVFGPEAKHRVWLVFDGDVLYIDRNGNGDLTEENERLTMPPVISSDSRIYAWERRIQIGDLKVAGLTHRNLSITQTQYRQKLQGSGDIGRSTAEEWQAYLDSIWRQTSDGLTCLISIELDPRCYGLFGEHYKIPLSQFAWIDRQGQLAFTGKASSCPIVHFGGPLTLRMQPLEKLHRGDNPDPTHIFLSSAGFGPGSFATISYDIVPTDVHPVMEIQFPTTSKSQKPITQRYVLKERC